MEAMHRLSYHPVVSAEQQAVYERNRREFMLLFDYAAAHGASREVSLALTKIQEALMWLNAHVACNWDDGGPHA